MLSAHSLWGIQEEEEERDRLHSLGRRRHVRFAQKHIGNRNIERDCKGIGIFTPTPKAQGYIWKTFTFPSLFSSRFFSGESLPFSSSFLPLASSQKTSNSLLPNPQKSRFPADNPTAADQKKSTIQLFELFLPPPFLPLFCFCGGRRTREKCPFFFLQPLPIKSFFIFAMSEGKKRKEKKRGKERGKSITHPNHSAFLRQIKGC